MRWAVFDVDGTLFPPSSMEKTFILLMLRKGALPSRNIFYYFLAGIYRTFSAGPAEGFKSNKYYLMNLPVRPIHQAALHLINQSIWPAISKTGKDRISLYRKKHYKILIMSGSPDFLTYPLCRYLNPDYTIAADLAVRQSCFTGKLKGLHPYGKRKTLLLQRLKDELAIDFEQSVVFANHHADYDHMTLFGEAVAVNPTPRLEAMAHIRHWPVEKWEEEMVRDSGNFGSQLKNK